MIKRVRNLSLPEGCKIPTRSEVLHLPSLEPKEAHDNDSDSEGGTYTLDDDRNEKLKMARKLDNSLGLTNLVGKKEKSDNVAEWMRKSASNNWRSCTSTPSQSMCDVRSGASSVCSDRGTKPPISRIPSAKRINQNSGTLSASRRRNHNSFKDIPDTQSYLNETEKIVLAMQNRLLLRQRESPAQQKQLSNSGDSCSSDKKYTTRYNRAFSLRRERSNQSTEDTKRVTSNAARTPNSRPSRADQSQKSTLRSDQSHRSTSRTSTNTLPNNKEEFINWKRRKSYDPLKAAAEGRKNNLAKGNNKAETKGDVTNKRLSVIRSASFHGTGQNSPASPTDCGSDLWYSGSFRSYSNSAHNTSTESLSQLSQLSVGAASISSLLKGSYRDMVDVRNLAANLKNITHETSILALELSRQLGCESSLKYGNGCENGQSSDSYTEQPFLNVLRDDLTAVFTNVECIYKSLKGIKARCD